MSQSRNICSLPLSLFCVWAGVGREWGKEARVSKVTVFTTTSWCFKEESPVQAVRLDSVPGGPLGPE